MAENASDRSPDDNMDPDKEARMLLNPPNESVQFTQNATSTNGQVVLPISNGNSSSGVGMSKKELMKYANDPFWVRLRMFLFILFWVVWLAMLVGAVLIIMFAPGCPATASLPWWKKCSLVQVGIKSQGTTHKEQLSHAASEMKALKENLKVLADSKMDGLLLTGLDPFLLANLNNDTEKETGELRGLVNELMLAAHEDAVKGKVIVALRLTETPTTHPWFVAGKKNDSEYNKFYIWKTEDEAGKYTNLSIGWDYDTDVSRMKYARKMSDSALLNYANAGVQEKMKELVYTWVRTKLDGIQADGDFWVADSQGNVGPSDEVNMQVRKWIKTGGENKALLIEDSKLAATEEKEGIDTDAIFELSPESSLWNEVSKSNNLQDTLKKIFSRYVQLEKENAEKVKANTTTDGTPEKANVGAGWRSFKVLFPQADGNEVVAKQGLSIGEGVLASFYLLPKSTPIVLTEGPVADQLAKVNASNFLKELDKLRRDNSESFMLGATQLPEVTKSDQVFAVSRRYAEKNAYLLLINFAGTSQEVEVKGSFPDPTLFNAKVVLTDSQNTGAKGSAINLSAVKLEPKQVLLVEFAPKE